jgi:hypothetical protein
MSEDTREQRAFAAEVKFLVSPDQGEAIRSWARQRLSPDPYGVGIDADCYTTTSLYFDTPSQDVFFRRGSYGRAKYRIRRYASADMVFLERKLRTEDLLSKRRTLVPLGDVTWLDDAPDQWPARWAGSWFGHRLIARRLSPVCQVAYDRTARLAATPYGLARLTLDEQVRAWPTSEIAFQSGTARPVLTDRVIVEMKFRVEMPAVFKALVETFGLNPTSVSKYRLSMAALELASVPTPEEVPCQTS